MAATLTATPATLAVATRQRQQIAATRRRLLTSARLAEQAGNGRLARELRAKAARPLG